MPTSLSSPECRAPRRFDSTVAATLAPQLSMLMSAYGTKRTYRGEVAMSALRGEADMVCVTACRLGPGPDILASIDTLGHPTTRRVGRNVRYGRTACGAAARGHSRGGCCRIQSANGCRRGRHAGPT